MSFFLGPVLTTLDIQSAVTHTLPMNTLTATATVEGILWAVTLVPLSELTVTRDGVLVESSWDRQTLKSTRNEIPRALTLALREAISASDR